MRTEQNLWTANDGWKRNGPALQSSDVQLVFAFGAPSIFESGERFSEVGRMYPNAHVVGCSTSGEIMATRVYDESLAVTACQFDHTQIRTAKVCLEQGSSSVIAGAQLARELAGQGLVHVLVFSDGLHVNGSELVRGLVQNLPPGVEVTGGLSGDGTRFAKTVIHCDGVSAGNQIVAVGFYGDRLRVDCGTMGGWDAFGPDRLITRASGNELFELDSQSALSLYTRYLGDHAAGLPATGLLFPLTIWGKDIPKPVVRTILAVNEARGSLIFAGEIPEGCSARLMRANNERLIDGAAGAARRCREGMQGQSGELGLLISCVGRRLVLKQRVEEEVEAVAEIFPQMPLTGFYSYGEIAPFQSMEKCELHNQTMTITTFREVA